MITSPLLHLKNAPTGRGCEKDQEMFDGFSAEGVTSHQAEGAALSALAQFLDVHEVAISNVKSVHMAAAAISGGIHMVSFNAVFEEPEVSNAIWKGDRETWLLGRGKGSQLLPIVKAHLVAKGAQPTADFDGFSYNGGITRIEKFTIPVDPVNPGGNSAKTADKICNPLGLDVMLMGKKKQMDTLSCYRKFFKIKIGRNFMMKYKEGEESQNNVSYLSMTTLVALMAVTSLITGIAISLRRRARRARFAEVDQDEPA